MAKKIRLILIFNILFAQFPSIFSQVMEPEQDCINAIPVCQDIYVQTNSYRHQGLDSLEINRNISCLGSGEENDVWYIFTVQTSGLLNFTIEPINLADDYDWAVYDLTNNSCADIRSNAALEVSCNYSAFPGSTGPNLPGGNNSNGAGGSRRNRPIPVMAGQTFVVNVSNFLGTSSGYTLDFSASTAVIFDNIPPVVDTVVADCNGGIEVTFSENIVCSTVDISDFQVTGPGGPYTITNVSSTNCDQGGTFDSRFVVSVTPAMATAGRYALTLQGDVEDNCGNIGVYGTDSLDLVIPNIAASASPDTLCLGESTTLSTPAQTGFSYVWSGGNMGASVTITPNISATYTVFATDPFGCTSIGSVPVTVHDTATTSFTLAPTNVCVDEQVLLTFTGTHDPSAVFSWDLGGATIVSGTGPGPYQLTWDAAGSKQVSLEIEQFSCVSKSLATDIDVNPLPSSDFTLPGAPVCFGSFATINYADTPSPSATYTWDFDGGIVISGTGSGPYEVDWTTPGPKNISLTVVDNGCTSPTTQNTLEVVANPVAAISPVADQCFDGNSFSFSYTGTSAISTYNWDFGDRSPVSSSPTPTHSYTSSGLYTVSVVVTDANGCSNSTTEDLEVYPELLAEFSFTSVCEGATTTFTDQSNSNGIPITSWAWDFGNGDIASGPSPSYVYQTFGSYTTSLTVITSQGCQAVASRTVDAYENPVAGFSFVNACDEVPIQFQENSQINTSTLSYTWEFGDGQTGIGPNPSHLYPGFGDFEVTMSVLTAQGCSDQVVDTISVYPKPTADVDVQAVCHLDSSRFINNSSILMPGNINAYRWDFGNGGQSDDRAPVFVYNTPGIYDVQYIVSSDLGCTDTAIVSATVYPNPIPNFVVESVCQETEAVFSNLSTIDGGITADVIDRYSWDFGDNTPESTLENPTHAFALGGNFEITLTTTSNKGCEESHRQNLYIYPNPLAPIAQDDTVCTGFPAFLVAQPNAEPRVDHVNWYIDPQGIDPFETNFSFVTPPVEQTQTYFVEAVSTFGCISPRTEISAYTFDESFGTLAVSDSILDIPQAIGEFAIIGGSPIAAYEWDFGDGITSTSEAPVHQYKYPGKYLVEVAFETVNGCSGELAKWIEVKELIVVSIPSAFSPNGDGINDLFHIGSNLITDMDFMVYNRWGELVYQSNNPDFEWNGNGMNGKQLLEGVYVYLFEGIDIQGRTVRKTGSISLFK